MLAAIITVTLALLAALTWRRYEYAVALVAGLLPAYLLRVSILSMPTNMLELMIGVLVVVGLASPVIRNHWKQATRSVPLPIVVTIALFLLAAGISTVISPHIETSLGIVKGWIVAPLVFGWIVYGLPSKKSRTAVTRALTISTAVMAAFALFQINSQPRISGIYDTPNSLALFVAPVFVMTAWISRKRTWGIVATGVMAAAVIGTQSVSAMVAVITSLLIGVALFRRSPWKRYAPGMAVLMALFLLAIVATGKAAYIARPFTDAGATSSLSVRIQLWSVGWDLVRQRPLLGVGLGVFEPLYQQELHARFVEYDGSGAVPLPEFVFRDPHNWILSFWLNLGLLGLVAFVALHIITFRRAYPAIKKDPHLQAVSLALIALLIFGLTDTIFWKNDLAALHFILLAVVLRHAG